MTIQESIEFFEDNYRDYVTAMQAGVKLTDHQEKYFEALTNILYAVTKFCGPDWKAAPPEAKWWAMNWAGDSWYYIDEPKVEENGLPFYEGTTCGQGPTLRDKQKRPESM